MSKEIKSVESMRAMAPEENSTTVHEEELSQQNGIKDKKLLCYKLRRNDSLDIEARSV